MRSRRLERLPLQPRTLLQSKGRVHGVSNMSRSAAASSTKSKRPFGRDPTCDTRSVAAWLVDGGRSPVTEIEDEVKTTVADRSQHLDILIDRIRRISE